MNFWREYLLPAHRRALSRIKSMDRSTLWPFLGAWVGSFIALEGYSFIVDSGVPDQRTQLILTLLFSALITQLITFYGYLLLPRRTIEQETNTPLSPVRKIWRESGVDLVSESLCVAALVLLWAVLGIVPGLFKAVRWGFVPYITMTSVKYRAGDLHARTESDRLIRGITWVIVLIWTAYFGLDFALTWGEGLAANWSFQPLAFAWRFLLSMVSFYLLIYSLLLDFGIYELRLKNLGEAKNESDV